MLRQVNIGKADSPEDWRLREAATFAFGSILDGPPPDKLAALVAVGLPFLLNALKDPHTAVRHTTAWTIGAARAVVRQDVGTRSLGLWCHGQVAESHGQAWWPRRLPILLDAPKHWHTAAWHTIA